MKDHVRMPCLRAFTSLFPKEKYKLQRPCIKVEWLIADVSLLPFNRTCEDFLASFESSTR
jgi:hypothetical protein